MGSCRISKWQNGSIVKFTDLLELNGCATRANRRCDRGRSVVYKQPPSTTLHRDSIIIQRLTNPVSLAQKKNHTASKTIRNINFKRIRLAAAVSPDFCLLVEGKFLPQTAIDLWLDHRSLSGGPVCRASPAPVPFNRALGPAYCHQYWDNHGGLFKLQSAFWSYGWCLMGEPRYMFVLQYHNYTSVVGL